MTDLKGIQKELDDMEKALEVPEAGHEDLRTDPPPTDAPKTQLAPTQAPKTEAPKTDAPPTEAPKTEAPKTDAPKTDTPATEAPKEDPRDKELREMREEIEKLKSGKTTKAPPTLPPPTEPPISEEDFLAGADLDELTRDPKLFNQLLNKIYKKAREDARGDMRRGDELMVRSIPDIVKNNIAITAKLRAVNEQFYKDNKDLIPWKKTVAIVFEEKMAANPGKKYDELLPDVATETRKRLGLQKQATDNDDPPPKLPKKKGGPRQQPKPDLTDIEKEMDDMDKALGLD